MAEIVLMVIVGLLLVDRFLRDRHLAERETGWADERQSLLNRLEARTPGEFVGLERARQSPKPRDPEMPLANGLRPDEHLVGG